MWELLDTEEEDFAFEELDSFKELDFLEDEDLTLEDEDFALEEDDFALEELETFLEDDDSSIEDISIWNQSSSLH
jgi:hypothetical protein